MNESNEQQTAYKRCQVPTQCKQADKLYIKLIWIRMFNICL